MAIRRVSSGRRYSPLCRLDQERACPYPRVAVRAIVTALTMLLCAGAIAGEGTRSTQKPLSDKENPGTSQENKKGSPNAPVLKPNLLETACKETAAADKVLEAVTKLPATVEQVRAVQRFKHLPLDRSSSVLVFRPFEKEIEEGKEKAKEKIAYRILLSVREGDATRVALLNANQILAAVATRGAGGTDFRSVEPGEKTLLSFTPELPTAESTMLWNSATIYVVGCSAGKDPSLPLFTGSVATNVTSTVLCKVLAVCAVMFFYILAAVGTFYIHKAQRKKDEVGYDPNHERVGTNYATFSAHLINPVVLTAGPDGRGSAAKLQVLFFSLVVFGLVSYIWMLTGHLSDMSDTVLLLMGIAGVGATASAGIDVAKKRLDFDNWAWLINIGWLPKGGVSEINSARWKDIVTTEGEFDVYRFQMITFTVLVGAALLSEGAALADLGSFAIPQALLGILGLSQVVYIGGKLAAPPAMSDLNDQVKKLRDTETKLREGISKATPESIVGSAPQLPADGTELRKRVGNAYEEYLRMFETTHTMFESAFGLKVLPEKQKPSFQEMLSKLTGQ